MSYTLMADLYLGDVSSQVYEFLLRPRPCLFLNSQGVDWRNDPNYAQWQAGPVIDRPAQLATGLKRAFESHTGEYLAVQQQMFARSFDLDDRPSSSRAAEVLMRLADQTAGRVGLSRAAG
jgi:CDP-glycerol glycerophosphotransferase (TagB/SpsB family)